MQRATSGASLPGAIDPADFVSEIDNPYFTLKPGTTFVYEAETDEGLETVNFKVTGNTVEILGVMCIEVIDTVRLDGEIIERTRDWFAQDKAGNVWYFGEASRDFENGEVVSSEGSWRAGKGGALPGIIMLTDPEVGDAYRQEWAPGVAEDRARVVDLDASGTVPYGDFDGLLKTKDINPLDGGAFEFKFYSSKVGAVVLEIDPETGNRLELVEIRRVGGASRDAIEGAFGADRIDGLGGNDILTGKGGDDVVRGGEGADRLSGDGGADQLSGKAGADRLDGGDGSDTLRGGDGRDTFIFTSLANGRREVDTLLDYESGDRIELPDSEASVRNEVLKDGVWRLVLEGDGDVIRLPGASDRDGDESILDDLHIV